MDLCEGSKLSPNELPSDVPGALRYIAECWPVVDAHIEEVFFNDKEAIAEVLNADGESFFGLTSSTFAGRQVITIEKPDIDESNVYRMMLSLVR